MAQGAAAPPARPVAQPRSSDAEALIPRIPDSMRATTAIGASEVTATHGGLGGLASYGRTRSGDNKPADGSDESEASARGGSVVLKKAGRASPPPPCKETRRTSLAPAMLGLPAPPARTCAGQQALHVEVLTSAGGRAVMFRTLSEDSRVEDKALVRSKVESVAHLSIRPASLQLGLSERSDALNHACRVLGLAASFKDYARSVHGAYGVTELRGRVRGDTAAVRDADA